MNQPIVRSVARSIDSRGERAVLVFTLFKFTFPSLFVEADRDESHHVMSTPIKRRHINNIFAFFEAQRCSNKEEGKESTTDKRSADS